MLENIFTLLSLIPIKIISAEIFLSLFKTCFCFLSSGSGNFEFGNLLIFISKVLSSISFGSISSFSLSTTSEGEIIHFLTICITPTNKVQK
jgi:hypothetical protein